MKPLEFFTTNVGKRIYRDSDGCTCQTCLEVVKNGLVVGSEGHAQYLYDTQMDFAADGVMLNYRNDYYEKHLQPA